MEYRIAKYIAHCGYCSRRDAEKLILEKKVKKNNKIVDNLATKVQQDDVIQVSGKTLSLELEDKIIIFNKPKGCITSKKDEKDRKTIYDILPEEFKNFKYIGRLDFNSEGLLLLTNNGEISRYLELPKNKIIRKYKVRIFGNNNNINSINNALKGVRIEGIIYKFKEVKVLNNEKNNVWLEIALEEGKNREIKRVMSYFGFEVSRLIRTNYHIFSLDNIKTGNYQIVKNKIVKQIRKNIS